MVLSSTAASFIFCLQNQIICPYEGRVSIASLDALLCDHVDRKHEKLKSKREPPMALPRMHPRLAGTRKAGAGGVPIISGEDEGRRLL